MKMLRCMALAVLMIPAFVSAQTYPSPTFQSLTLQNPLTAANGGTGINNGSRTLTLGGNLATSGAFGITLTATGTTALTLPTSGTLLTSSAASSTYAPIASPTFTGTVTIPSGASISGYLTTSSAASTYAPLASPTFTGTVTAANVTATGTITPSQTSGIVGTNTTNSANAGSVGEYVSATASSVSLTTTIATNITSISLTAGDWDVSGGIFLSGSTTNIVNATGGSSTTSATFGSVGTYFQYAGSAAGAYGSAIPTIRVSISSTTTVYCVGSATFSTGTATGSCLIRARRIR